MSLFGWSYPAGAESDPFAPYNMDADARCQDCGNDPDECECNSYLHIIDESAAIAMEEIRRMAQSARRSIGQQYRYHMQAIRERK